MVVNIKKSTTVFFVIFLLFITTIIVVTADKGTFSSVGTHTSYSDFDNVVNTFFYANDSGAYLITLGGVGDGNPVSAVWRTTLDNTGGSVPDTTTIIGNLAYTTYLSGCAFDEENLTFYLAGGYTTGTTIQAYSLVNNTGWNTGDVLDKVIIKFGGVGYWHDNKCWYIGGSDLDDDPSYGAIYTYEPSTHTVTNYDTLALQVRTPGVCYSGSGDLVYIFGGAFQPAQYSAQIICYNMTSKVDTHVGNLTRGNSSYTSTIYNDVTGTYISGPSGIKQQPLHTNNITEWSPDWAPDPETGLINDSIINNFSYLSSSRLIWDDREDNKTVYLNGLGVPCCNVDIWKLDGLGEEVADANATETGWTTLSFGGKMEVIGFVSPWTTLSFGGKMEIIETPWTTLSFGGKMEVTGATTNQPPVQNGEVPANESIDVSLTPQLYVLCTDADSDAMNATWWSNSSGTWVQFASNWTSFASGTNITQSNSNFSSYSTTYRWSVNVSDGEDWTNNTYHFTTVAEGGVPASIINITCIYPVNGSLDVVRKPQCQIYVNSSDIVTVSVSFYYYRARAWVLGYTEPIVPLNSTVYWNFTKANDFATLYNWRVVVDDGVNETIGNYSFTTNVDTSETKSYSRPPPDEFINLEEDDSTGQAPSPEGGILGGILGVILGFEMIVYLIAVAIFLTVIILFFIICRKKE